jgi:hypothetical protein
MTCAGSRVWLAEGEGMGRCSVPFHQVQGVKCGWLARLAGRCEHQGLGQRGAGRGRQRHWGYASCQ